MKPKAITPRFTLLTVCILVLFLGGCNFLQAASPTPTVSQQIATLVASIDPSQPDTLDNPERLIGLGRAASPALAGLINSPSLTTRWAAIYYFSRLAQP